MQDDQNEAMVIFLNRATIKEIATLPAIGYKTDQLIYNHREMQGKFTSLMQIRNVHGINQTVFNKFLLQNQLTEKWNLNNFNLCDIGEIFNLMFVTSY